MIPTVGDYRGFKTGFHPWVGKDPLKEGMETLSSILAWRIPWTEEPGGPQSREPNTTVQLTP